MHPRMSASLVHLHSQGAAAWRAEDEAEATHDASPRAAATATVPLPQPPAAAVAQYTRQVAGHAATSDGVCFRAHRRRRSRVRADDSASASDAAADTLLKPVPAKPKGRREQRFYEQAEQLRATVDAIVTAAVVPALDAAMTSCGSRERCATAVDVDPTTEWLSFLPRYYGALHQPHGQRHFAPTHLHAVHGSPADAPHYLHLEDLTAAYARPSLLDIKIGVHSHDPFECAVADSTDDQRAKIERERLKCPSQAETGFRICGARIWRPDPYGNTSAGCYEVRDKLWARSVTTDQIDQPFWSFLGHRPPTRPTPFAMRPTDATMRTATRVLPLFLDRLRRLLHLCQTAPRWRLYASSILFCYEVQPNLRAQLHLIDFGHAHPIADLPPGYEPSSPALDENYIVGVQSLITIFERMLTRAIDTVGQAVPASIAAPIRRRIASPPTPRTLRKLSTALCGAFVSRKTISAFLSYLISRRLILAGRANSVLFALSEDLPRVSVEMRQAGLHRSTSTQLMQELMTRALLGQLLRSQSSATELDGTNTSFARPEHTIDQVASDGHPRTRRWRAELLEQHGRDAEQCMRGLSLAAFDAARSRATAVEA